MRITGWGRKRRLRCAFKQNFTKDEADRNFSRSAFLLDFPAVERRAVRQNREPLLLVRKTAKQHVRRRTGNISVVLSGRR